MWMNVAEVLGGQGALFTSKTAGVIISRYPCMAGLRSATVGTRVAAILMLFSLFFLLVSIASPYWIQAHNELGSSHSGLFHVCILGKCDEFIHHNIAGWFRVVQAFMILSVFTCIAADVALVLYIFLIALEIFRRRFLMAAFGFNVTTAVLTLIGIIVYGTDEGTDISTLSWGFYMAIVSAFFNVASSTVLAMEFVHRPPKPVDERIILQPQTSLVEIRESRSASVLSVLSPTQNPEQRPLNKTEVRMRSYSSSVGSPPSFGSPLETVMSLDSDNKFTYDSKAIPT